MSANLDLVRSIYADWERGDFSNVGWADPAIEFQFVDGPSPGVGKGTGEMARMWREFLSPWDEVRTAVSDCREIDDEHVLAFTESSGSAKRGHMPIPVEWTRAAALFYIRDGKVTKHVIYFDRDRALADLGLEE